MGWGSTMRERSWALPCRIAPVRFTLTWRPRYAVRPAARAPRLPRTWRPAQNPFPKMFARCFGSGCPSADSELDRDNSRKQSPMAYGREELHNEPPINADERG